MSTRTETFKHKSIGLLQASSGEVLRLYSSLTLSKERSTSGDAGTYDPEIPWTEDTKLGKPRQYLNQDFYKLREECYKSKRLFEDPEFPAKDCSLYCVKPSSKKLIWKRPSVWL